jgi:transaldolase
MKENPLLKLHTFGQSVWSDFIRRGMIVSGEFAQMMTEVGLRGVTSNPAIFEKAIDGSRDYDEAIRTLALAGKSALEIYEALAVEDIQLAADLFRPLYNHAEGSDGLVSLEVSPRLAHDTQGTLVEARRLWKLVNRPNVMIKVPGTAEGLPAIQQLIAEGINVNVTLLFGLPRYGQVAQAYLSGLEARLSQGKPLKYISSVASFFLSRIDNLVDPMLEKHIQGGGPQSELAKSMRGEVAIASARVAYHMYQETVGSERFLHLAAHGALPQRLLWASTSTKNPDYSDVKYVEALIGPDTVNTMPLETIQAYRDHGQPAERLSSRAQESHQLLHHLSDLGIDLSATTQALEDDGVQKFVKPFDTLLNTLKNKRAEAVSRPAGAQKATAGVA